LLGAGFANGPSQNLERQRVRYQNLDFKELSTLLGAMLYYFSLGYFLLIPAHSKGWMSQGWGTCLWISEWSGGAVVS
jgi:hypothetical protein